MSSVIINEKEYELPEFNFDAICQLEENGVYLLNMDKENPKIATMLRGLVAWIIDASPEVASREIQAHIANGGNIGDILNEVTKELGRSGFFNQNRQGGNRQQRRNKQNNTNHSQKS